MKLDLAQFAATIPQLSSKTAFCVAFSGGVDSHVLLHLLAEYRKLNPTINLRAVHINHGLSKNALQWQVHCQHICAELNIPLLTHHIQIKKISGESLEALAREARYAFFEILLKPEEILLTAHNADDQAETILLQLLRGSGVMGLSAMPPIKSFSCTELVRPLLKFSRTAIQSYAEENQLKWIEDESNSDLSFDRNYIRHQVMPLIKERWPQALITLARSAENCAETQQLLSEIAIEDHAGNKLLNLNELLNLSEKRQSNLVREWIVRQGFSLPTKKQLQEIFRTVIYARHDATPSVEWNGQQVLRFQQRLYLMKKDTLNLEGWQQTWKLSERLALPGKLGYLQAIEGQGTGLRPELRDRILTVRFRQGGEKIQPPGRQTHTLKKLWQEWSVPYWLRDQIPLLYLDNTLIAVVGYCIAQGYQVTPDRLGLMPIISPHANGWHE